MEKTLTAGGAGGRSKIRPAEPVYGKGEDLFNAISHIVGGALGIAILIALFIAASANPTPNKYAAAGIYSLSIIILYTMSALYHFSRRAGQKGCSGYSITARYFFS